MTIVLRLLPLRALLVYLSTLLLGWWLLFRVMYAWFAVSPCPPYFFETMAICNPLATLARANTNDPLDPQTAQRLEALTGLTMDEMRLLYRPHDANYLFYHPKFHRSPTPAEFQEMKAIYLRELVVRRPHVLLADRTEMFTGTLLSPHYLTANHLLSDYHIHRMFLREGWDVNTSVSRWDPARRFYLKAEAFTTKWKIFFWNTGLSTIVILIPAIFFRRFPITATASLIILIQLPLLYVALPMNYMKYVHFLACGPMFIIPLMLLERHALRASKLA
ncbi:MAG: hypothetical protein ACRCZF_01205, partial [Gemmataceae bacterium]